MTIDWIMAKLKMKQYTCFHCKKYLSNSCFNVLNKYANTYSEGGGWCVPIKDTHYYVAVNPNDIFCKKFKYKRNFK